jgi:DNA polymerase elongation subunit (family B)
VISKLLRQGVTDYKSIFPHVAAAIQLSNEGKAPMKGQNIQYIYTNSEHKNHCVELQHYQDRKLGQRISYMTKKNIYSYYLMLQKQC